MTSEAYDPTLHGTVTPSVQREPLVLQHDPRITDDLPVLVIGAGIGGLTAALSLARHGVPVRVFEQAPALGEIGAGLTLYQNAVRGWVDLGIGDKVHELAQEPLTGASFVWDTGEMLRYTGPRDPAPDVTSAREYRIHRADLHAILADALEEARPGSITVNAQLVDCEQDADGVTAVFKDGSRVRGSVLVGADGIRSAVRGSTFGFSPPRFTGYVAWRGLVPTAGLPEKAVDPMTTAIRGPNAMFVRYQVRNGTTLNYVAFSDQPGWEVETWTEPSTIEEVKSHFQGWFPEIHAIIDATAPGTCFKWALFDRPPMEHWSDGRITLLGDAAHPMVPFIGQAACCAAEDGYVLGKALGTIPDLHEALVRYEQARIPRAAEFQQLAWESRFALDGSAPTQEEWASDAYQDRIRRVALLQTFDPVTAPV